MKHGLVIDIDFKPVPSRWITTSFGSKRKLPPDYRVSAVIPRPLQRIIRNRRAEATFLYVE